MLSGAQTFVPQMAYSLIQRYEILHAHAEQLTLDHNMVVQKNEALEKEIDQLRLELQQYKVLCLLKSLSKPKAM